MEHSLLLNGKFAVAWAIIPFFSLEDRCIHFLSRLSKKPSYLSSNPAPFGPPPPPPPPCCYRWWPQAAGDSGRGHVRLAKMLYVIHGHNVMSTHLLEVSLFGVGTVCSVSKGMRVLGRLRQATNKYLPPPPPAAATPPSTAPASGGSARITLKVRPGSPLFGHAGGKGGLHALLVRLQLRGGPSPARGHHPRQDGSHRLR